MNIHRSLSVCCAALAVLLASLALPTLLAQDAPAPAAVAIVQTAESAKPASTGEAVKPAAEEPKAEAEATAEAAEEPAKPKSKLAGTFWALVPPLVAIILALITKEVYSSLFIGILLGGCFAAGAHPLAIVDTILNDGLIEAVKGTAGIFIFLVILGVLVALINRTGAAAAFGAWAKTHVKTRIGSILATFLLGVLIFIQ